MLCGFSSLWWPFGWNWSYLAFLGIIWRTCGSKCRGEGGGIFLTLCVECCLVDSHSFGVNLSNHPLPCLPTNWTWLNLTSVHCVSLVFIGVGGNCNFIISYKLCPGHWWITVSWINVCTPCWAWRFIMSYKQSTLAVWDEITYPFPNFNDAAVKVWE